MNLVARLATVMLLSSALTIDTSAKSPDPGLGGDDVGLATVLDDAAVRRLMRQQAETGDTKAMVDYAEWLRTASSTDYPEGLRNQAEAERYDRLAAERGDPLGQINAGVWCMINPLRQTPPGACKSDVEAVRWFHLAMDQGNADGMAFYGYMVEFGRGGLAKDPALAARYYTDAGKRGSASGRAFLNDMVEFADRSPREPKP